MQKILLEIADNGIIKTVTDDNINAAGEVFESKVVYDLENGDIVSTKLNMLYELSEDMGMELGNSKQPDQIKIIADWGDSYVPQIEDKAELQLRIKNMEKTLTKMKAAFDKL